MTTMSTERGPEPRERGPEAARLGAVLAVHTTLANPFVIAVLVLVIAAVVFLRRRTRS